MTESLGAYRAELRAFEDEWYARYCGEPRALGSSCWDTNLDNLREIDARHGVRPDDLRAYSIAAYLAERREIDEEWRRLNREKREDAGWNEKDSPEKWASERRYWARLDDCKARHFPGLNSLRPETIDSVPKLWAHITHHLAVVSQAMAGLQPDPPGHRPLTCSTDVQQAYSLLHRLKVPWAPRPPYPSFTQREAMDEMERIANRLEQEDAERVSAQRFQQLHAVTCRDVPQLSIWLEGALRWLQDRVQARLVSWALPHFW
jgi:hypothetical protein